MMKNFRAQHGGSQSEEFQLCTAVNGGSNYELLLEEAVNAQQSLKDFKNIQFKLNQKIETLNNQINTKQKILNELFDDFNNEIINSPKSKFFTIEDLNLLNIIRRERVGRGGRKPDQYRDTNDILESNVSTKKKIIPISSII